LITLTNSGLKQALKLKQENEGDLRVYLDGKGCDGFFYGVSFDTRSDDDHVFSQEGIDLICDPESSKFVKGSEVEWVDDERGQGFLVNNPNHKKFRGKFYKRNNWEQRLT
jgi:iron-sulfur cluster assembly accessory protein